MLWCLSIFVFLYCIILNYSEEWFVLFYFKHSFTNDLPNSVYHHLRCELEPRSWRGILDTTLCDKFVSDLRQTGLWFSPGILISSTNETDCHDITEILLKVALNTINQPTKPTNALLAH